MRKDAGKVIMMGRKGTIICEIVLFIAVVSLSSAVWGWTPATTHRIVTDATMLLPETLQTFVKTHWNDIALAMNRQSVMKEELPEHYYWHRRTDQGLAPKIIAQEACTSVKMVRNRKSFSKVFSRFGRIAYITSECFNPLNLDNSDPQEIYYYKSFEEFVERSTPYFRIHFDGYSLMQIRQSELQDEVKVRFRKSGELYTPLTNAYKERLAQGKPFEFGFQSVPFGIGMISYSRAVTTIVDLWCSIWKAAGGELENGPFDKEE